MPTVERPKRINVRATEDELRMLAEIAEHLGINQAGVIRLWIRTEHARLLGKKRP